VNSIAPLRDESAEALPGLDALLEDPGRAATLSAETARLLLIRCAALQALLATCLLRPTAERQFPAPGAPATAIDSGPDREYLSIRALASRIPYAEGTIRNLMSQGRLRLGEHYIKPNGRVMFRWSAVRAWLDQPPDRRR
jgi:hypothetical protein